MKKRLVLSKHLKWLVAIFLICASCAPHKVQCTIITEMGDIQLELYPESAPATVANFLAYVDVGSYDSTHFFRVCNPRNEADRQVQINVIQGGDVAENLLLPPIDIETTEESGLQHLNGTISMARAEPNSAQSSYFICVGSQPSLDHGGSRNPDGFGFAAFGKVTSGMNIVRKIQVLPDSGQLLIDRVLVYSIIRSEK